MIRYRLHENVLIELPRIRKKGPLKRSLKKKSVCQETLEKAKEICADLDLHPISIEVVKNIKRHPLYKKGGAPYTGFYVTPRLVRELYAIKQGRALIVIEENDREFLETLFHELGHALAPKNFEGGYSELWAWFFAYILLRTAGCMKEAADCWPEVSAWQELSEYEENLKFGKKRNASRKNREAFLLAM